MEIDLEQAKVICSQALPFSVIGKMSDKEMLGSANCIILYAAGITQRSQMTDFEMTVKVEWKKP